VHAVVVTVTINDFDRGREMLEQRIVPAVSQAPGFIAGYWTRSEDNRGLSLIAVESEEAARAVAEQVKSQAPQDDAVTLESVEVREVVANA
jgi:pseudouridine-5'-phosphate glycosidase